MTGYSADLPPPRFNLAAYCLAGAARHAPGKTALIVARDDDAGHDEHWSYRRLEDEVMRIAGGLEALGLERASRLLIRMTNTPDYALTFLAAIAIGLVPIPASSQLTPAEIDMLIADSAASAIAVSPEMALPPSPSLPLITADDIARFKTSGARADYADMAANDPAFLIYTSGSSGTPKGVLHAHRVAWGRRPMYRGWYGISERDVMLHTGAFNWTYTLGVGMLDPWANGATTVLYVGPTEVEIWPSLIRRSGATIIASVPGLYRRMLKYCDLKPGALGHLRHGLSAGEALAEPLADEWRARTGLPLYEALGMSEISTYISSAPTIPVRRGSPGKPQEGRAVAILPIEAQDDGGAQPLPPGETGLIAIHRTDPGLMLGYWNRPDDEASIFRGDWFIGGDLGHMDEDSYVWFDGRNDDVMNPMGTRVSPQEVERALITHDQVAEAAVSEIRIDDDISVIAAFIVPAREITDAAKAAADIAAHAKEHLAAYKTPREIAFVPTLPRTANGKLRRNDLPGTDASGIAFFRVR